MKSFYFFDRLLDAFNFIKNHCNGRTLERNPDWNGGDDGYNEYIFESQAVKDHPYYIKVIGEYVL